MRETPARTLAKADARAAGMCVIEEMQGTVRQSSGTGNSGWRLYTQ